ncbi:MAG TPA: vitamin K epoxide reductase family protein [Longimicrobiales bacterium]|nr:vitamin K epoxide reductase family protein [Longimicrobiales bacterium]
MRWLQWLSLAIVAIAGPAASAVAQDAGPQVRAALFYSPQCPHCHDVMRDHLPPLLERHGEALRIVAINVDTQQGQALYRAVVQHFRLPRERLGVPALVAGERILVGAWEIPSLLPGLVDAGLAGAGVDWPAIPELRSFLSLQGIAAGPTVELQSWMVAGGAAAGGEPVVRILGREGGAAASSVKERFMGDPAGNAIAVVVLLGMVVVLVLSVRRVWRPDRPMAEWPVWVVPALAVVGTGIAAYLSFVEVTGAEAVCGPVGDCNRVQLSPYAALAGVPIGVLGVVGYLLIGGLWITGRTQRRIQLLIWALAAGGVAFSIYLTFLEPFVIGATCMWCINSAVAMTLILVAATPAASRARQRPRGSRRARGRGKRAVAVAD